MLSVPPSRLAASLGLRRTVRAAPPSAAAATARSTAANVRLSVSLSCCITPRNVSAAAEPAAGMPVGSASRSRIWRIRPSGSRRLPADQFAQQVGARRSACGCLGGGGDGVGVERWRLGCVALEVEELQRQLHAALAVDDGVVQLLDQRDLPPRSPSTTRTATAAGCGRTGRRRSGWRGRAAGASCPAWAARCGGRGSGGRSCGSSTHIGRRQVGRAPAAPAGAAAGPRRWRAPCRRSSRSKSGGRSRIVTLANVLDEVRILLQSPHQALRRRSSCGRTAAGRTCGGGYRVQAADRGRLAGCDCDGTAQSATNVSPASAPRPSAAPSAARRRRRRGDGCARRRGWCRRRRPAPNHSGAVRTTAPRRQHRGREERRRCVAAGEAGGGRSAHRRTRGSPASVGRTRRNSRLMPWLTMRLSAPMSAANSIDLVGVRRRWSTPRAAPMRCQIRLKSPSCAGGGEDACR